MRTPNSWASRWLLGSAMYRMVAAPTSMAPRKIVSCEPAPTCMEATPWERIKATAVASLPMGENTPAMSPPRP